MDLGKYVTFADSTASEVSKKTDLFAEKMAELDKNLNGGYARLDMAIAGLVGEAGEVADVWKKVKFHDKPWTAEKKEEMIKELGDVMWYMAQAAIALNVPLDEIIEKNIEKLKARHPEGFSNIYMK